MKTRLRCVGALALACGLLVAHESIAEGDLAGPTRWFPGFTFSTTQPGSAIVPAATEPGSAWRIVYANWDALADSELGPEPDRQPQQGPAPESSVLATIHDRLRAGPLLTLDAPLVFIPSGVRGPPDLHHVDLIEPAGLCTPSFDGLRAYLEIRWDEEAGFSAGVSLDF